MGVVLDLILVLLLLAGVVDGLRIGVFRALLRLIGWFVSILIVMIFYVPIANLLHGIFPQSWWNVVNFLTFVLLFSVPYGIIEGATLPVLRRRYTRRSDGDVAVRTSWGGNYSAISRIIGGIIMFFVTAAGLGLLIIALLLLQWDWLNQMIAGSSTAPFFVDFAQLFAFAIPELERWWVNFFNNPPAVTPPVPAPVG